LQDTTMRLDGPFGAHGKHDCDEASEQGRRPYQEEAAVRASVG
jgi:hypothetical protein